MADVSQPSPLTPALQRAHALVATGDLVAARVLLERAVELGRQKLGEDDPGVLVTLRELAGVHRRADDPASARRVLEEAYAAGQWRLGDSDPLLLQISYDLGVVAQELGNRHEARKAFGRVAEHGPAVLGAQHRAVTRAQTYLHQDQNPASVREKALPPATPRGSPWVDPPQRPEAVEVAPREPRHVPSWPVGELRQPDPPRLREREPAGRPGVLVGPPELSRDLLPDRGTGSAYVSMGESRRRGMALFAVVAATVAAVVAVAALVFVLVDRAGEPAEPVRASDVPTLGGEPPGGVRLDDRGASVEVSWTDPAGGRVPFIVTMARPGARLKPVSDVGPGQTSFRMSGLNEGLNYCFAVVAVYATDRFASSEQVCTSRS